LLGCPPHGPPRRGTTGCRFSRAYRSLAAYHTRPIG
jgi:hypothetical protein